LFVKAPRRELYDQADDPTSARNLAEDRGPVADRIGADMDDFRRRSSGMTAPATLPVDPALVERLASLGYVAGTAAAPASGIDPKDRITVSNTLHNALVDIESGETERAAARLEQVVSTDPQIFMAQLQLGISRARQRKYALAISPLRKAIELQPDSTMAHHEMGVALFETGDWKTSALHFEIVVARMPRFADGRYSLGSVYARIDRVPEALGELRSALELEPRHYRANLLLGRILFLQGQAASARPHLERAVEVQPDSREAHAFLAEAYEKLGRAADAERERKRAEQLARPRTP
jgi:tetratricopeptide (TPR) repeat protein